MQCRTCFMEAAYAATICPKLIDSKVLSIEIHFNLLVCALIGTLWRDSEGTISTILTEMDVAPLSGKTVRWNLKGMSGSVITDGLGYGQIRVVSPVSQKRERVRLAVGNEFLYMRAGEVTKIITPRPWCDQI